jgi:hypothetical protein
MKRLLRGSVVLAVAVGFLSCSGDPTSDLRQPAGITATPTTVFVDVGETKPVIASLVDEQGNQVASDFTITDVGAGVTVVQDSTFQNTTAGVNIDNQVRFQVTATSIANSSFTLNAGGKSLVVPVRVTPSTVAIAISNQAPALGDTITITAPAGVLFTDSSEVTFAGGPAGDIVSMSPDRSQLVVVPGPNVTGLITVAHTTVNYDEGLDFTITSTDTVATSPPITDIAGAVLSNPTPALGEIVTLTLPPGIKVLPVAALPLTSIGNTDTIGVLADSGFIVEGATNPRDVVVSPDSSTITFVPAPNSDSTITVRGVVYTRTPQFPQILSTLPSDSAFVGTITKITTPVVDSLPASVSSATPAVNAPVVLTSTNPQFTFVDPAVVAVGLDSSAIVTGQTANSVTFLPAPGSTGKVGVGAVDVVGFGIPLTSTAPAITTSTTVASLPGTGSTATAPPLPVPALDGTAGLYDAGTFPADLLDQGAAIDQIYKVVVSTAGDYTFTVNWANTADVDLYLCSTADCSGADDPDFFAASADQPESGTLTLAPGTYYLVAELFAGDPPAWLSFRIDHTATPPPAP